MDAEGFGSLICIETRLTVNGTPGSGPEHGGSRMSGSHAEQRGLSSGQRQTAQPLGVVY